MLSILRIGDLATCGHVPVTGSTNVFANNLGVTRANLDTLNCPGTPKRYVEGLNTVFVNNLPLVHIGDMNNHPGVAIEGSDNVFGDDAGGSEPAGMAIIRGTTYTNFANSIQPSIDPVTASEHHADDTDVDGPRTGSDRVNRVVQRYEERKQGKQEQVETVVKTAPTSTSSNIAAINASYVDILDKPPGFDFYNPPFQLSPNYNLAQISTNTLVSKYTVQPQVGLSIVQIICNLRSLCINVLEPMRAKYGNSMRVNSGFRIGVGTSQHYTGEAVDVSFTDTSNSDSSFARAQEIANFFNYDQYIYEQQNSIWHHLSYKATGSNRRQVLTKPRGNRYLQGLHQITV